MASAQPDAYTASKNSAAFFTIPDSGLLHITGEHQVDFLQRQSSNDVRLISPQNAVLTVLTSPTARILDVLLLIKENDAIAAITLPGLARLTADYLKSRIFFMDQVSVEIISDQFVQIDLMGPRRAEILKHIGLAHTPKNPGEVVEAALNGDLKFKILALDPAFGLGYRLIVPQQNLLTIREGLLEAGAAQMSAEAYALLRLEAGLPSVGSELNEDYTPLEAGLKNAISETKGCYTGQEVIARQITYDKVTRLLCKIKLEKPTTPGVKLWMRGKNAGMITSTADSPHEGPIALAYIKRPYFESGTDLFAGEKEVDGVLATVLPRSP